MRMRLSMCAVDPRRRHTITSTAHINILFKQGTHANMHSLDGGAGDGVVL